MSFRFEQPSNEDDFEEFCERLLQKHFKCETLSLYGKRGEKQDGIDIIDTAATQPFRAAQCKHHEFTKTLQPQKLEDEVEKATGSEFELDEYYVLTTAKKSTWAQKRVIKINQDRAYGQKFVTTLWTWSEIEGLLSNLNERERDYVVNGGTGRDASALEPMLREVMRETLAANKLVATDGVLQARLQSVEVLLKEENREMAKYELSKIDELSTTTTSSNDRYLVKRLNAKYLMLVGEQEEAARLFLEAYDLQPLLEQARINRAIAYDLLGNHARAFELATELKQEGVRSEPIPAILQRTAPRPIDQDLAKWLADFLDTSEELNLCYAMDYLDEAKYEDALHAANRVKQINPASSRAALIEGMVHHSQGVNDKGQARTSFLETAYQKYNLAFSEDTDSLPERAQPDALRNLASVQYLLGRDDPKKTFEKAIEKARDKGPFYSSYLNYLCSREDYETAKHQLSMIPDGVSFQDEQFLRNTIEYNSNPDVDKAQLIESMFLLGREIENKRRIECLVLAVQWSTQSQLIAEALVNLESTKDSTDPLTYQACVSWLQLEGGATQSAAEAARQAVLLISEESDPQLVSLVGRLLMKMELYDEAVPVLVQVADFSKLGDDTRALLDCAMKAGRHDVVLDICQKLRAANAGTSKTLDLEIQLLSRYQPTNALAILEAELEDDAQNKRLYAAWCFLRTRLQGPVEDLDVGRLPGWDEMPVVDAHIVLFPLIAAGYHRLAIEFAYAQLRANPKEELAHGRYLWLFLQFARGSGLPLDPTKVEDETAVYYTEGDGPPQVIIIDSAAAEPLARDEIRPDSVLAELLKSKTVGDEVDVAKNGLQPRKIKIDAVVSKYVHRYQDVMQNMQIRFPGTSAIQLIKMEQEGEFDISPIVQSLEERRKYVDQVLEEFKRLPASIAFLAKWLGLSYFEAFESLTALPEIGIRCCLGRNAKLASAVQRLRTRKKLILDLSTIFTLDKLRLWEKLADYELIVARSTVDELSVWQRDLGDNGLRSGGTTYLNDEGHLRLIEFSEREVSERQSHATRLLKRLQDDFEIRESTTMPAVPEAREQYEELEAIPLLETILLANEDKDSTLVADDVYVHWAASTDYKLSGIWSQLLLDELERSGNLEHRDFVDCNAKLIGWNFGPVQWNAEYAYAGCRLANGNVLLPPLDSVIRQFRNTQSSLRQRCSIAVEFFFKMYWHEDVSKFLHTSIIHAVLNAFGTRKAADLIREDARERFTPYENMYNDLVLNLQIWEQNYMGG